MAKWRAVFAFCGLSLSMAVSAAETITYTYDAKGRLVRVVRAGAVNSGIATSYARDKADNRVNVKTTGAPN